MKGRTSTSGSTTIEARVTSSARFLKRTTVLESSRREVPKNTHAAASRKADDTGRVDDAVYGRSYPVVQPAH